MDCNPPGFSVHGISQARILEWVAISFSKGFSWSRDWTCISCIGRQIFFFFFKPASHYCTSVKTNKQQKKKQLNANGRSQPWGETGLQVGLWCCSQTASFPLHTSSSISRENGLWQAALDLAPRLNPGQPACSHHRAQERKWPGLQDSVCRSGAPLLDCLLAPKASWESPNPLWLTTSPAYPLNGGSAREEGWGLGKRSTRNSFVLLDLHLKYIWKAVETLTRNRLPTQMLSTKKLPGIIILSIYQFVVRIWHILSLKVRNNNFPPWGLERDGILLQMLNSCDYQPGVRIWRLLSDHHITSSFQW